MQPILLIEDDVDMLSNLTEYLELEGYFVFSTNDADKGIEMACRFVPDLIICDMPGRVLTGLKFCGCW